MICARPWSLSGKLIARVFGQRLSCAGRPCPSNSQCVQDHVHLRVQRRAVSRPMLVDLVGGHVGGGRARERPAIIFVAVGPRPHAGVVGGEPALQPKLASCRSSAGANFFLGDGAGALGAQLPGMFFSRVRRSIDLTSPPPLARAVGRLLSVSSAVSIRKAGGISPL